MTAPSSPEAIVRKQILWRYGTGVTALEAARQVQAVYTEVVQHRAEEGKYTAPSIIDRMTICTAWVESLMGLNPSIPVLS